MSSENALDIIKNYDIVIDGTDNFPTRYLTNDVCVMLGKPNIYGSIFRFEGQASVFAPHLGGPCYRCLYPEPPPPGMVPPNWGDKIMHTSFRVGTSRIMASDGCTATPGFSGFSLSAEYYRIWFRDITMRVNTLLEKALGKLASEKKRELVIDRLMALEVDKDGAVDLAFAERKVVDPKDARRRDAV